MDIVPDSNCPECGNHLDAVTAVSEDASPKPGDLSICAYCGCMLQFDKDLLVEPISEEALKEAPKELWEAQEMILQRSILH